MPDVTIRVLDPQGQFLVTGDDTPPNSADGVSYWLAPNRRLVLAPTAPTGRFVSDVSDGLTMIELSGPGRHDLFAMGTTLTLPSTGCAQTVFAGVKVLTYAREATICLHVERSLSEWLMEWLETARTA